MTLGRGAHRILVVLDAINHRKLPKGCHVECFIDLALVDGTVTQIGHANLVFATVFVAKGNTGSERNLRTHDTMTTIEILFLGEHVHRAAFTAGIPAFAARQFGHHTGGIHAGCKHMSVIAITGDNTIFVRCGGLHADNNGFLPDIKVAETANETHAIQLTGFFFKATDQKHFTVIFEEIVTARLIVGARRAAFAFWCGRHVSSRWMAIA